MKVLEDEWSAKICKAEAAMKMTEKDTVWTVKDLKAKILDEEAAIALLQKEITTWVRFREGLMLRRKAKIEILNNAITVQNQNRADHIRLTEEAVHLVEEHAKKAEEKVMDDLLQRHITEVCESLPPQEIQEIENNDILSTELVALTSVFKDLTSQTDNLQRKIIHQAASAQMLLESVNEDNARITKNQLFNQKPTSKSVVRKLDDLQVSRLFEVNKYDKIDPTFELTSYFHFLWF